MGLGAESIHEDKDGNVIAEIDDGDHRIYRHDDISSDESIGDKLSTLYEKREKHVTAGKKIANTTSIETLPSEPNTGSDCGSAGEVPSRIEIIEITIAARIKN